MADGDQGREQTPGWHPDPHDPTIERRWDGNSWTDLTRPVAAPRAETWWQRPIVFVPGLLALLLALGGIGSLLQSDSLSNSPAAGTDSAGPSDRERYLDFLRDEIPSAASRNDQELVDGGRQVCDLLDDGMTRDQLATATVITGFDVQETASLLVAAVNTYCPEHRDVIE